MTDRINLVGIDHVQLAMPPGREDDARRFYEEVLDLYEVAKPVGLADRGGCWFFSTLGSVHVHLGVETDFRPATKAHPAFVVQDLEIARQRLADAGADVIDDDSIRGVHRLYTADPFGNRIELVAASDRGFTSPDWEAGRPEYR